MEITIPEGSLENGCPRFSLRGIARDPSDPLDGHARPELVRNLAAVLTRFAQGPNAALMLGATTVIVEVDTLLTPAYPELIFMIRDRMPNAEAHLRDVRGTVAVLCSANEQRQRTG